MDSELLIILDQLERDKGINKDILIEAVEAAVASAAKKVLNVENQEDIKVTIDRKTGKITAYAQGHEVRSKDFGRIAAQTAKQVVIQKIREAEKDVVFNEYHTRIGEIVSGGIYRFEKGNIIVDLGKTEGFLPRSEQSPRDAFKQGDRIRAYVLDVRRETRGPHIVLSRAHASFVKRLFELEVPEIFEGIVEVKALARDAGERTKIAVYSKDEKVDCVGACVGMRGTRVKSIVSELQGEKIDIVRYSSDIREYIQAALSPAEISQMLLNKADKKADLIVADDQLSLSIGKHGQNVRLASKLLGWELNIFSADQWKEKQGKSAESSLEVTALDAPGTSASSLDGLSGIGEKVLASLNQAGFDSIEKIAGTSVEALIDIKGIGKVKAEKIIREAQEFLQKRNG